MSEKNQPTTTGPHLIATFDTVEDVARSMDQEDRAALSRGITDMRERLEEHARFYDEHREQIDRLYKTLLDNGYAESDLARLLFPPAKWVAQQLQGEAGYGPVGDELVRRLRSCTPKGQSVIVTSCLAGMTVSEINNRRSGKAALTVNEAAQLAVAYGVTTGELLGIVDAEEVILLRLWRDMDQSKREALLCLLS